MRQSLYLAAVVSFLAVPLALSFVGPQQQPTARVTPTLLSTVIKSSYRSSSSSSQSQRLFSSVDETTTPTTSTSSPIQTSNRKEDGTAKAPQSDYDSIICGGGPAGLLAAIMLTRKFGPNHKIALCEVREDIPPSPTDESVWSDVARFYLLGIGHRGQRALKEFDVFEDFEKVSVPVQGRRDWQPGMTKVEDGNTTPAKKDVVSRVLARDKLVGLLHQHLVQNYIQSGGDANIDLLYGYQVDPIDFGKSGDDMVKVQISNKDGSSTVEATTKLLMGVDGAARTVANAMQQVDADRRASMNPFQRLLAPKPFSVTRYEDDNPRLFKSVPIQLPADWPKGLNYSARSKSNRITLEALPSDDKGSLCALLLLKPEDELAQANVEPSKLRAFFDEEFPQFGALIDDEEMARVATKSATALPAFRFVGPRLHMGSRTIVLGDAAHTVKPYYGLGCNTALEDVQIFSDILDESLAGAGEVSGKDAFAKAVPLFSKRRAADAEALVTISRNMDRPGKRFFLNFLLPLILDGIFHKAAPKIFGPNMFGMFQRKDIGFSQIRRKKRLDRTLQFSIIASVLAGMAASVKFAIARLARALGTSQLTLSGTMLLAGLAVGATKKLMAGSKQEETTAAIS